MESFYCKFCNKTMNLNSKPKHDYSKSHFYLTNYVIKKSNYHDVDLKNIEEIIIDCSNKYRYEFNEFCIQVKLTTICLQHKKKHIGNYLIRIFI